MRTINRLYNHNASPVRCLLALTLIASAAWADENPVGQWTILTNDGTGDTESTLTVAEENGALSGTVVNDLFTLDISNPLFEDDTLTFTLTIDNQGQTLDLEFAGKVSGDTIEGQLTTEFGDIPLTGTRGLAVTPIGDWKIVTNAGGQETESTLMISQADGAISGTIVSDLGALDIANPSFEGNTLKFDISIDAQGQTLDLAFSGEITGNTMNITWASEFGDFPGTGTRGSTASPVGEWSVTTDFGGQSSDSIMTIAESDGTLSGTIATEDGTTLTMEDTSYEGNTLTFHIAIEAEGQDITFNITATINGDDLNGEIETEFGNFTVAATRN